MATQRRSEICIYLASHPNRRSDAIAKYLGKDFNTVQTRLRELEKHGRIRRMNDTTRARDMKWSLANGELEITRPRVSLRAAENIDAMRAICRARLSAGLSANWVQEPEGITA